MNIVLEKSLINVHCMGMDSLVIKDAPNMVRMFIARHDHQLYRNAVKPSFVPLSVCLHKHHCDVTLMPIFGEIWNVTPSEDGDETRLVKPYQYRSAIAHGAGQFVALDSTSIPIKLDMYMIKRPLFLHADQLHTIYVPCGKPAAWWIWEGKEDPNYNSIAYSDAKLEEFSFDEMNQPMTEKQLKQDLELIGVYDYTI